jgi:hypothetical protein
MQDHIKVIGILWVIFGALSLCLALFAFLFFFGVAQIPNVENVSPGVLKIIGIIAASFLGLIQHKEWARILMLVISFISLVNFPFGMALGVYSMIVLFNPETVRMFQAPPPSK